MWRGSTRSARSSASALGVALVAAGCGALSDADAEEKVRRFAKAEYRAVLGRCERVEAGPRAHGARLFRCGLPGPNAALQRYLAAEAQPVDAKRWPKFVCFAVDEDGSSVRPHSYGYPDVVDPGTFDRSTPCSTVSG